MADKQHGIGITIFVFFHIVLANMFNTFYLILFNRVVIKFGELGRQLVPRYVWVICFKLIPRYFYERIKYI